MTSPAAPHGRWPGRGGGTAGCWPMTSTHQPLAHLVLVRAHLHRAAGAGRDAGLGRLRPALCHPELPRDGLCRAADDAGRVLALARGLLQQLLPRKLPVRTDPRRRRRPAGGTPAPDRPTPIAPRAGGRGRDVELGGRRYRAGARAWHRLRLYSWRARGRGHRRDHDRQGHPHRRGLDRRRLRHRLRPRQRRGATDGRGHLRPGPRDELRTDLREPCRAADQLPRLRGHAPVPDAAVPYATAGPRREGPWVWESPQRPPPRRPWPMRSSPPQASACARCRSAGRWISHEARNTPSPDRCRRSQCWNSCAG